MNGINVSQRRGEELAAAGYKIRLSPTTGFWVEVRNVSSQDITYKIRRTGDDVETIPADASPWSLPESPE